MEVFSLNVIPAKAGILGMYEKDTGLRRYDSIGGPFNVHPL